MADFTKIDWDKSQPAPTQAIRMIHANFPQVRDLGIYVCRNIKGTGTMSAHAQGRALDIGLNAYRPEKKVIGDALFHALIGVAQKTGVDDVIWNRQIWSVEKGGPRARIGNYKNGAPKNPHTDHIHVEWTHDGSQLERLRFLELEIATLRSGFEDLSKRFQTLA